jgi:tetratricopeptide (TPR) repeat protein
LNMRVVCFLLLLATFLMPCMGDQVAKTENGRKVLLKDNGTWEYLSPTSYQGSKDTASAGLKPQTALIFSEQSTASPTTDTGTDAPGKGQSPAATAPIKENPLMPLVLGGALFLLLALGAVIIYFLVIQPTKKRKLLTSAYQIVNSNNQSEFPKAKQLIEKAIVSGLKKNDIAEASFVLAYIGACLGQYREASTNLKRAESDKKETIYLTLWLMIKMEEYKEAYEIYRQWGDKVKGFRDAAKLISIACLNLGKKLWRERNIKAAVHYFEEVRALKVYEDMVPDTIMNHHITLGIMALFDKHLEEAEEHFTGAAEQSQKEGKPDIEAQLGLLLCTWRKEEYPQLDEHLTKVVNQLEVKITPAKEKKDLLIRNTLLWSAIALIFSWYRFKSNSGLPEKELEELKRRLDRVLEVDPDMGDPRFIMGLIDYYFSHETRREEAIENIDRSNIKIPEAELIVRSEKKREEAEKQIMKTFYTLTEKYLKDNTVPIDLRQSLKKRLEKLSFFKKMLEEAALDEVQEETAATLKEMKGRAKIIRNRIGSILKSDKRFSQDTTYKEELLTLMKTMDGLNKEITDKADALEKNEHLLLASTGEFLFCEEESAGTPAGRPTGGEPNV